MRVQVLNATGFRSIGASINLHLRPELTCLIGANEHGKSNILDALALLNDGGFETHDKSVLDRRDESPHLSCSMSLSEEDKESLAEVLDAHLATLSEETATEEQIRTATIYRNSAA